MKKKQNRKFIGFGVFLLCFVAVFAFMTFQSKADEKKVKYVDYEYVSAEEAMEQAKTVNGTVSEGGYLYGGLYSEYEKDGETKLAGISSPEVGKTYKLKCVPEEVLSIKAQVSGELTDDDEDNDGEKASIRFITGIDSLQYKYIGFKIQLQNSDSVLNPPTNKYVSTKLYAIGQSEQDAGENTYYDTPDSLIHSSAKYFKTYAINNTPQKVYNHEFTVTAYWQTLDGQYVEGTNTIGVKSINLGRSWVYVVSDSTTTEELGTYSHPFHSMETAAAYDINKNLCVILKSNITPSSTISVDDDITKMTVSSYSGNAYTIANSERDGYTITRGIEGTIFSVASGKEMIFTGKTTLDGAVGSKDCAYAMIANSGTLTVDSAATLQNAYNKGSQNLSAGAIKNEGTLTLKGTVKNCGSGSGSAVASNNSITISGGQLTENSGRALIVLAGTATINDSSFTDNGTSSIVTHGGAIRIYEGTPTVTISNTSFTKNKATDSGGAIATSVAGTLEISDSTFTSNQTTGTDNTYGGAIELGGALARTVSITGCTFNGNSVSSDTSASEYGARGGALYINGSTNEIKITNCTITNNTAIAAQNYQTNSHQGNGGGVYIFRDCTSPVNITDCTIKSNIATSEGGGVFIGKGSATVTIENTEGNTTYEGVVSNKAGRGAGIFAVNTGTVTVKNETISNNTCEIPSNPKEDAPYGTAAGCFLAGTGTTELNGCNIKSNTAVIQGGGFLVGAGAGAVKLTDCSVQSNTGTFGAGGCTYATALTISGGDFTSNKSTELGGGGIYMNDADTTTTGDTSLSISDGCVIDSNTATGGGGGVRIMNGTATINACTISNNTADGGAGILVDTATVTLQNGTAVKDNESFSGGGGIMTTGTEVTLNVSGTSTNPCVISGNKATSDGGGIYLGPYNIYDDSGNETGYEMGKITVDMDYCEIDGGWPSEEVNADYVNAVRGGGIYVYCNASITMDDCSIYNNGANGNGGGICFAGGEQTTTLTNCSITYNDTFAPNEGFSGCGAGIYASCEGTLKLTSCNVDWNTASDNATYYEYATEGNGGGIYLRAGNGVVMTITGTEDNMSSVSNNKACIGGGLYLSNNVSSTTPNKISYCKISENETTTRNDTLACPNVFDDNGNTTNLGSTKGIGGGVLIRGNACASIDNSTISGNSARKGGGIFMSNSTAEKTLTLDNCTFTSNIASGSHGGGAIFLNVLATNAIVSMKGCDFESNQAMAARGGAIRCERGTLVAEACTFTSNSDLTGGGALFSNTYSKSDYYGFGSEDGSATAIKSTPDATYTFYSNVTLNGCTFTSNTSTDGAAAVDARGYLRMLGTNTVHGTEITSSNYTSNTNVFSYRNGVTSTTIGSIGIVFQ